MATRWFLAFWLAATSLALLPGLVRAQASFGGPSYDRQAIPVTLDEAEFLAVRSGMDDAGKAAARALTEASIDNLRRSTRRFGRAVERAHTTLPREDRKGIRAIIDEAVATRDSTYESTSHAILNDLRALVPSGAAGADGWAAFERRRHRRLYLTQSPRVGVGVDLIEIARTAKIDSVPAVLEALTPYELELDRLLVARHPIFLESDAKLDLAMERGEEVEAERLYNAMRDADCAILRLQRTSGRKLIDAAPADARNHLRDLLLGARSFMGDSQDPVRLRAKQLIESGRLDAERLTRLRAAAASFDTRTRTLDEGHMTFAEDSQCSTTYAQSRAGQDQTDALQWLEESRKLRAELLAALDAVATEDDLDAIEPR